MASINSDNDKTAGTSVQDLTPYSVLFFFFKTMLGFRKDIIKYIFLKKGICNVVFETGEMKGIDHSL